MILKYIFLVIVICTSIFNKVFGQDDCVPGVIQNLRITANATLFWELRPNERCHVTKFNVKIVGDADDSYEFSSYVTHVQLSFLNVCEEWRFTVIPISFEGVTGLARSLVSRIPLPEGPKAVANVQIFANATLTWELNPDEDCVVTQFQVNILGDMQDAYYFRVYVPYVDISFLEICDEWRFTIFPVSYYGLYGDGKVSTNYIPLPSDADLTLSYFNATSLGERDVFLEWDLENRTYGDCTLHYRLTVHDEQLGITQDVYLQGNALYLTFISPCVPYQLSLRAVNRAFPIIEGPQRTTEIEIPPKPQIAPSLRTFDVQATTISMTWNLEGESNRCPVRNLHVDAGNNFNISVPLQDSLFPEPVEVNLRGLQSNTMYYMRIYVENSGGVSQAFPIAVQTLEFSPN